MNDLVQHQRLASGFVPAASEPSAAGVLDILTAKLQNCTVKRVVGHVVGFIDITLNAGDPGPSGIGSKAVVYPAPIGAANTVQQLRTTITIRGTQGVAAPGTALLIFTTVIAGPEIGLAANVVRVLFATAAAAADADFSFEIDRVIDPSQEP